MIIIKKALRRNSPLNINKKLSTKQPLCVRAGYSKAHPAGLKSQDCQQCVYLRAALRRENAARHALRAKIKKIKEQRQRECLAIFGPGFRGYQAYDYRDQTYDTNNRQFILLLNSYNKIRLPMRCMACNEERPLAGFAPVFLDTDLSDVDIEDVNKLRLYCWSCYDQAA